eukprot:PhF_6_TR27004/c1_g1_i1/m.39426
MLTLTSNHTTTVTPIKSSSSSLSASNPNMNGSSPSILPYPYNFYFSQHLSTEDWDQVRELLEWHDAYGSFVRNTVVLRVAGAIVVPMDTLFPMYEAWIPTWRFVQPPLKPLQRSFTWINDVGTAMTFRADPMRWKDKSETEHLGYGSSGITLIHPTVQGKDISRAHNEWDSHVRLGIEFAPTSIGNNAVFVAKISQSGAWSKDIAMVPIQGAGDGQYEVHLCGRGLTVTRVDGTYSNTTVGHATLPWNVDDNAVLQLGVHRFANGNAVITGLK